MPTRTSKGTDVDSSLGIRVEVCIKKAKGLTGKFQLSLFVLGK